MVAEKEKMDRKQCQWCKQELAHAAYYRHLHDDVGAVCPGKYSGPSGQQYTESCSEADDLDSTFDFGSECSDEDLDGQPGDLHLSACDPVDDMESTTVNESSPSEESSSESGVDGEEIWDSSDDDREGQGLDKTNQEGNSLSHNPHSVVVMISLFLSYFQLVFRLSERGVVCLLSFLGSFVSYLSSLIPESAFLRQLKLIFPKSLYHIRKLLRSNQTGTFEYVVCPNCDALYLPSECVIKVGSHLESRKCDFIKFPNHPHRSRRKKCNELLMKWIKLGKTTKLVPRKTFMYNSVIGALQRMASKQGFLHSCEHWRNRTYIPAETYADVYDGAVWKSLLYLDRRPFLACPHNLCFSLNVDWFNPYDETIYSVGAIYLVIQNLPRSERFKIENVLLVGLIPGPHEPKLSINTYLTPLVDEMKKLYYGVTFKNPSSFFGSTTLRAIISCVACDLPATRKVCGFSSFSATLGCSKCKKRFPTEVFGDKPDYSGYDVDNWEKRSHKEHVKSGVNA